MVSIDFLLRAVAAELCVYGVQTIVELRRGRGAQPDLGCNHHAEYGHSSNLWLISAASAGSTCMRTSPAAMAGLPSCLLLFCLDTLAAGVEGVGTEDSALALYEDAEGDRGVLADQVCV